MATPKSKRDIIFTAPQGQYTLRRYDHPRSQLRAWNGADHYLLEKLVMELESDQPRRTLIVNEDFGALIPLIRRNVGRILDEGRLYGTAAITQYLGQKPA